MVICQILLNLELEIYKYHDLSLLESADVITKGAYISHWDNGGSPFLSLSVSPFFPPPSPLSIFNYPWLF